MPRRNHRPRRPKSHPQAAPQETIAEPSNWNQIAAELVRRGIRSKAILDSSPPPIPGSNRQPKDAFTDRWRETNQPEVSTA